MHNTWNSSVTQVQEIRAINVSDIFCVWSEKSRQLCLEYQVPSDIFLMKAESVN